MKHTTKRPEYRPHGLGNSNAARRLGVTYLLSINGKHPSGISQVSGRVEYADDNAFPLLFLTSQAAKAFLRKAERLGNSFPQESVSVLTLAS